MATFIRTDTGESLTTDGVLGETYTPSAAVTSHPIEDGTTIADHVQRLPYTLSITALWTTTPAPERAGTLPTGSARLDAVREFIAKLFDTPSPLDIYSARSGVLLNAILVRATTAAPINSGLVITLEFQEIIIVAGSAVALPKLSIPAKNAGVAPVSDVGAVNTDTPTTATAATYTSTLSKILGTAP